MLARFSSLTSGGLERLLVHVRIPLYRNGYALVINAASTSGFGMLYWVLAARHYPPEAIGINSALVASMMFLATVSHLNLTNALNRFIPVAGRLAGRLVLYSYLTGILVSLVASSIFIIGVNFWSPELAFLKSNPFYFFWFCAATAAWCVLIIQDCALTGLRQATWVPLVNLAFVFARIAMVIGLASALTQFGVFASWTVPLLCFIPLTNLLIFWHLMPRHAKTNPGNGIRLSPSQVVRFASADYGASLSWMASTNLLPLLILIWAGPLATAYFFLPWTICYALHLVSVNMGMSLIAEASNDGTKLNEYSFKAFVQTARLLLPVVLLLVVGAPYILRLFGSDYAEEGTTLLRLLVLSAIPHMINSLYISYARVLRQMMKIFLVFASLSGLGLLLSYVLIGPFGIAGVGLAWLISEILVASVLLLTQIRQRWLFPAKGSVST